MLTLSCYIFILGLLAPTSLYSRVALVKSLRVHNVRGPCKVFVVVACSIAMIVEPTNRDAAVF
jgi:hypothetical protein